MRRRSFRILVVVACIADTGIAAAQPATAGGALAETLFRDGKDLMAQGRFIEACPKLAESERIDPGLGTLLALAFCHEKEGKTATAWSEFMTARGLAQRTNDVERGRLARSYVEQLEPRLVHVTIRIRAETQRVPGLEVRHNGVALAEATWGTAAPVDPGEQVVEATAPGRQPWSARFTVHEGDQTHAIEVPVLEPIAGALPPPRLAASTLPPPDGSSRSGRTWGLAVGGVGIAAVAVGAYFGARAIGKNNDAKALCEPMNCASPEGIDLNGQARSSATVSTVAIAAGLVALGVPLKLTPPPSVDEPNTAQKTFAAFAPLTSNTLASLFTVSEEPTWKIQTPFASPCASRMSVPPTAMLIVDPEV